jgi:hypothetical protein
MAKRMKKSPDFFEHNPLDPVNAATGTADKPRSRTANSGLKPQKRKVGFYLSESLLERFNRSFYELKLKGQSIENKSALLEAVLEFALDDIDRGDDSHIIKGFQRRY